MGLTQILASHISRKIWIWLGPVSNLLCHRCLFDLWSPNHEADDPAVEKSFAPLGWLLLGMGLGCTEDVGPLQPVAPGCSPFMEEHVGSPGMS